MALDIIDRRVTQAIAVTSTVAWVLSLVADLLVDTYDPPASISVVFMAIVGAAVGHRWIGREGNGNGGG